MAERGPQRPRYIRWMILIYFWLFQFVVGYIAISLLFPKLASYFASAQNYSPLEASLDKNTTTPRNRLSENNIHDDCNDCRLVADSIDELLRQPKVFDSSQRDVLRIDLDRIKKSVCKNILKDGHRESCRVFFYNNLASAEKWQKTPAKVSYYDSVCIRDLKLCCPRNSYGPKCTRCQRCNHNEHCDGEGSRAGNGSCVCKQGHTGPNCDSCARGYYLERIPDQEASKELKAQCKRCHKSCVYCRHDGPLGCEVCNPGYTWLETYGCSDIDECLQSNNKICGDNTFCVNTEGSYFCYECDRACDGCHGDGPDMCLKCAYGYKKQDGNCVAMRKTVLPPEANYFRYGIYLGLGICTCIILHNNIYLASVIGLGVAIYIGFSEYIMSSHNQELSQLGAMPSLKI